VKKETIEEFLARGGTIKKNQIPKFELDPPKDKEENRSAMKKTFAWGNGVKK
jgi:hypothetical protein